MKVDQGTPPSKFVPFTVTVETPEEAAMLLGAVGPVSPSKVRAIAAARPQFTVDQLRERDNDALCVLYKACSTALENAGLQK